MGLPENGSPQNLMDDDQLPSGQMGVFRDPRFRTHPKIRWLVLNPTLSHHIWRLVCYTPTWPSFNDIFSIFRWWSMVKSPILSLRVTMFHFFFTVWLPFSLLNQRFCWSNGQTTISTTELILKHPFCWLSHHFGCSKIPFLLGSAPRLSRLSRVARRQALTLLYIGGARSCSDLLSCQETDGAGESLAKAKAKKRGLHENIQVEPLWPR